MALTDAQLTDVRRYCGYAAYGTTQPLTADQDVVYMSFGMVEMSLYKRLTSLTAAEEAVAVQYLTTLAGLETAIPTAGANLDTDKAAVWERNRNEVGDRARLFDSWRLRLCQFIGVAPGPGLSAGGGIRIGRA